MDFKQIEAFVNVVKYKSFSKAADASFLTQPTISTHINTLEKEFGTRLIDRCSKEALPTKQGKLLFKYAINMLNMREKATFSLKSFTNEIEGILEIQASSVPGEYMVPSLITKFREKYPKVKFYLEQSDSSNVENNILEQKGEIGFIGYKGNNNSLLYEKLTTDKIVLITPQNEKFINLKGQKIKLEDFIDEPFVWREQGSATRKEFEDKISDLGYSKQMNVVARMNSMEAIKQAVSNGLGISIISKIAIENNLDNREFLTFEIKEINLDREFYLVRNKNIALSPTAEMFKEFVLHNMK